MLEDTGMVKHLGRRRHDRTSQKTQRHGKTCWQMNSKCTTERPGREHMLED